MTYENFLTEAGARLATSLDGIGENAPEWRVLQARDAAVDMTLERLDDPEALGGLVRDRPDFLDIRPMHAFSIRQILKSVLARELEKDLKPQVEEYLAGANNAPSP